LFLFVFFLSVFVQRDTLFGPIAINCSQALTLIWPQHMSMLHKPVSSCQKLQEQQRKQHKNASSCKQLEVWALLLGCNDVACCSVGHID